ncbi:hypothetical protein [Ruegeria sp. 6PALISEP08]|uniref:hypothetical protein n=1 Tax=Ruegeria sp. 6PALISEP08 TaxID=1225660 RepID=UPI00067EF4F0|nr:hypothetical protein [Ruegeria sp. 6PALISEP08]
MRKGTLFFYLIPATVVAFRVAVVFEVHFAQPSHTPGHFHGGTHTVSALQQGWQLTFSPIWEIGEKRIFFHLSRALLSKI